MKSTLTGRVNNHRFVVQQIEQLIQTKGITVVSRPHAYGLWKLCGEVIDHVIIWPPMVIILNTSLDMKNDIDKWLGMGNAEMLSYFNEYHVVKAQQSYGPFGHRGLSVLIFEGNKSGYYATKSLHNEFIKRGLDRNAWLSGRALYSRNHRQLHGYLARKQDLDDFNRHNQGNNMIMFDINSYKEIVVKDISQNSAKHVPTH